MQSRCIHLTEYQSGQLLNTCEKKYDCLTAGLAKVAVQCSADTFVVNQSLVLRFNICGENRHLRQARNRYQQCYDELANINRQN